MATPRQRIAPFLMFAGNAEEALRYYVATFPESAILSLIRYGANEAGKEGTVMLARFSLLGQEFMCIDSSVEHGFTFTPATSHYVACETEAEIGHLFERLSADGQVLMPLAAYPFSEKYGWVQDKFGVSWQLSLEEPLKNGS